MILNLLKIVINVKIENINLLKMFTCSILTVHQGAETHPVGKKGLSFF